jgi:hypothetical protein
MRVLLRDLVGIGAARICSWLVDDVFANSCLETSAFGVEEAGLIGGNVVQRRFAFDFLEKFHELVVGGQPFMDGRTQVERFKRIMARTRWLEKRTGLVEQSLAIARIVEGLVGFEQTQSFAHAKPD